MRYLLLALLAACGRSSTPTETAAPPPSTAPMSKPSSGWGLPGECINAAPNTKLPAYCSHPECFGDPPVPPSCAPYLNQK